MKSAKLPVDYWMTELAWQVPTWPYSSTAYHFIVYWLSFKISQNTSNTSATDFKSATVILELSICLIHVPTNYYSFVFFVVFFYFIFNFHLQFSFVLVSLQSPDFSCLSLGFVLKCFVITFNISLGFFFIL